MPVSISSQIVNYSVQPMGYRACLARAQEVNEAQWGSEKFASSFQNLPTPPPLPTASRGHLITPFESN